MRDVEYYEKRLAEEIKAREKAEAEVDRLNDIIEHVYEYSHEDVEPLDGSLGQVRELKAEVERLREALRYRDLAIIGVLEQAKDTVWVSDTGTLKDCIDLWIDLGIWMPEDLEKAQQEAGNE